MYQRQPYISNFTLVASNLVLLIGLEPIRPKVNRFSYYSIFLQPLMSCSLDYVFNCSSCLVYSLYTFTDFSDLARYCLQHYLVRVSPNQPRFTYISLHKCSNYLSLQRLPFRHRSINFSWQILLPSSTQLRLITLFRSSSNCH